MVTPPNTTGELVPTKTGVELLKAGIWETGWLVMPIPINETRIVLPNMKSTDFLLASLKREGLVKPAIRARAERKNRPPNKWTIVRL